MKRILIVAGLLLAAPAQAHIAGHPEWDEWLMAQKVPDGRNSGSRNDYCCDKSDAYIIDENTELRQGEGGDPEVFVEGAWHTYPNRGDGKPGNTVMGVYDNPTGHVVAWLYHGLPRCLASGTGG